MTTAIRNGGRHKHPACARKRERFEPKQAGHSMTTHSGRSRRHRQAGVVVVVVVAGQRWWWWGEGGASGVARWGHGGDPHGVLEPCRNGVVCLEAAPIVLLDVRLKGGICVVPVRRERQRVAGAHPPLQGAERQQTNGTHKTPTRTASGIVRTYTSFGGKKQERGDDDVGLAATQRPDVQGVEAGWIGAMGCTVAAYHGSGDLFAGLTARRLCWQRHRVREEILGRR